MIGCRTEPGTGVLRRRPRACARLRDACPFGGASSAGTVGSSSEEWAASTMQLSPSGLRSENALLATAQIRALPKRPRADSRRLPGPHRRIARGTGGRRRDQAGRQSQPCQSRRDPPFKPLHSHKRPDRVAVRSGGQPIRPTAWTRTGRRCRTRFANPASIIRDRREAPAMRGGCRTKVGLSGPAR